MIMILYCGCFKKYSLKIRYISPVLLVLSLLLAFSCSRKYTANIKTSKVDTAKPFRIIVISDLNSSYGSVTYNAEVTAVVKELAIIKPDIILCGGDMVAGQKASLTQQNIRDMWMGFKQTVLMPIKQLNIPFGFTLGNHDASPSYHTDRTLAKEFWMNNVNAVNLDFVDSSHYPFYYSYIKSNVFFMSWDAAGAKVSTDVYNWMKMQLSAKTAKEASIRILLGHLPLYPIVDHKNKLGEVNAAADSALSFFKDNGIDLYISGHQHAFYPARKDGIRLLNAGCIGSGERKIMGHTDSAKKAYTIIEVPIQRPAEFRYTSFIPGSNEMIDPNGLPDSVIGFNGILRREDL